MSGERKLHRADLLVEEYKADALFLREQLASGETCDGTPFTLSLEVGSSTLLFKRGDGPWLAVSPAHMIEAMLRVAGEL